MAESESTWASAPPVALRHQPLRCNRWCCRRLRRLTEFPVNVDIVADGQCHTRGLIERAAEAYAAGAAGHCRSSRSPSPPFAVLLANDVLVIDMVIAGVINSAARRRPTDWACQDVAVRSLRRIAGERRLSMTASRSPDQIAPP